MIEEYSKQIEKQAQESSEREELWKVKYAKQNEKISSLRFQLQHVQNELISEKEQNQTTIENLDKFTSDLKHEGESLSRTIKNLTGNLHEAVEQRAIAEVKAIQA